MKFVKQITNRVSAGPQEERRLGMCDEDLAQVNALGSEVFSG